MIFKEHVLHQYIYKLVAIRIESLYKQKKHMNFSCKSSKTWSFEGNYHSIPPNHNKAYWKWYPALRYSSINENIMLPWGIDTVDIPNSTNKFRNIQNASHSLKHWTQCRRIYRWIGVDRMYQCHSINCILWYPVGSILFKMLVRGVVLIHCSKRPKMQGNNAKQGIIICYQYFKVLKTT